MKKICILLLLCSSFTTRGQQYSSSILRPKCLTLKRFLEINHYQPLLWNDSASIRLYDKWMEVLDEAKVFFTKADISQLELYKTKLDEEMQGKEWNFFDKSTQLFRARLKQVDSIVKNELAKPIDFSKPDSLSNAFNTYAADTKELQKRWQQYMKWKILNMIATSQIDTAKQVNLDISATDFAAKEKRSRAKLQHRFAVTIEDKAFNYKDFEKDMGNLYLNMICWCYDPHTSYMNFDSKQDFDTEMSAAAYSAGISVKQGENGGYEIAYLEPGGPAWRSGELHTGDVVLKIRKGNEPVMELEDMEKDEVEALLQGANNEKIEITIRTAGGTQKTVPLTKEKIADDEGIVKSYVLHGKKNIGYIDLPGFYTREGDNTEASFNGCANDLSKEIIKLKKDTIAGLILDLRYNGGGSLWEALQLAGIFIDIGPVCSIKEKDGKISFLKDPNRGTVYDGPLVVMINGQSASASELTAAVLQDYNRALIVGSTTYGKGTAQVVLPMDTLLREGSRITNNHYEDFVKVTERKFFRVNGGTTQWKGVEPDIPLPEIFNKDYKRENGNASALLPDMSKKGYYQPLPVIPISNLKVKSYERVNNDSAFQQVRKFSDWAMNRNKGFKIPLQWASYTSYYKNAMDMYSGIEKAEETNKKNIDVSNSNFDKEKYKFASDTGKKINEKILKRIEQDSYVMEACNILMDWIY